MASWIPSLNITIIIIIIIIIIVIFIFIIINQSDTSLCIHTNIFRLSCMKLRIRVKNLNDVFASVWFNVMPKRNEK